MGCNGVFLTLHQAQTQLDFHFPRIKEYVKRPPMFSHEALDFQKLLPWVSVCLCFKIGYPMFPLLPPPLRLRSYSPMMCLSRPGCSRRNNKSFSPFLGKWQTGSLSQPFHHFQNTLVTKHMQIHRCYTLLCISPFPCEPPRSFTISTCVFWSSHNCQSSHRLWRPQGARSATTPGHFIHIW